MRSLKLAVLTAAAIGLLAPATGWAQRKRPSRGGPLGGPAVGATLPDVAAYDASGKAFRLSSLKGSYTVLVFGCLT